MAEDSGEVVREMAESVAATNLKTLGDGPGFYQNMAYANAISYQQGMNSINQALVGKIAESIIATNPAEGGTDIVGLMQLVKAGQTTPPVTA